MGKALESKSFFRAVGSSILTFCVVPPAGINLTIFTFHWQTIEYFSKAAKFLCVISTQESEQRHREFRSYRICINTYKNILPQSHQVTKIIISLFPKPRLGEDTAVVACPKKFLSKFQIQNLSGKLFCHQQQIIIEPRDSGVREM